jgi:hypothetical protein
MIEMINPRVLYKALSKILIFSKLNHSRSKKLADRIDSMRAEFDKSGFVPEKSVKSFVRLNIELSIGIYLSDSDLESHIFDLENNQDLREAWFNPSNSYKSMRE